MDWKYNRKSRTFYGKSEEGEYTFRISENGLFLGLEYQEGTNIYLETASIQDGEIVVETLVVDKLGSKTKKGISKLLANKEKLNSLPGRKTRALAQLVLAEADKLE